MAVKVADNIILTRLRMDCSLTSYQGSAEELVVDRRKLLMVVRRRYHNTVVAGRLDLIQLQILLLLFAVIFSVCVF